MQKICGIAKMHTLDDSQSLLGIRDYIGLDEIALPCYMVSMLTISLAKISKAET